MCECRVPLGKKQAGQMVKKWGCNGVWNLSTRYVNTSVKKCEGVQGQRMSNIIGTQSKTKQGSDG